MRAYIEGNNADPKPFRWVKSADLDPLCGSSLASVKRFCLRTLGADTTDEALARTSGAGH